MKSASVFKYLIIIISSAWFIPVSCSTGLYTGTSILSWTDSRDVLKGQQLHSKVHCVYEDSTGTLKYSLFNELPSTNISFFMKNDHGSIKTGEFTTVAYSVLSKTDSDQLIETAYQDDDNIIWFRYRGSSSGIAPISSRMMYFGYLFQSFAFAFGFALLIYFGGRRIRKKFILESGSLM